MLSYLSRSPGIGGAIKSAPEDFLVEEISLDGTLCGLNRKFTRPDEAGPYTHFILQKTNWSTNSAISEIAKRLRTNERNFNFAGSKDKCAITTQLVSVRGDLREPLLSLRIKDISINGAWYSAERVRLGELLGNHFTITVRDACDDAQERAVAISHELGKKIPNYFGEQRFGSTRKNTHLIGEKLLQEDFGGALDLFLCNSEGETHAEAKLARKELEGTGDFARALNSFPKHLRLERSMLAHLARTPDDKVAAFRSLPRNILLMFIHAYQSDLFNRLLSDRIREGPLELEEGEYYCGETLGFPDLNKTEAEGWICGKLIGYGTPLNERERALLEEIGVEKEAFKMKHLPEIRSKGTYRALLAPLKDFKVSGSESRVMFRFALPSGSYATVAMREFMDGKG